MSNPSLVTIDESSLLASQWADEREAVLADSASLWGYAEIHSDEQLEVVASIAKRAKRLVKQLSEKRLEITRPADEFKKRVCAIEKTETKRLNDLVEATTKAMSAYVSERYRRADEERRRLELEQARVAEAEVERQRKAAEANSAFGIDAPIITQTANISDVSFVQTETQPKVSNAAFSEMWTYQVTDAARVPRELCSPDPEKIKAFLKVKKAEGYRFDEIIVEGITISTTVQVRSR